MISRPRYVFQLNPDNAHVMTIIHLKTKGGRPKSPNLSGQPLLLRPAVLGSILLAGCVILNIIFF